jgi:hypothetical protein
MAVWAVVVTENVGTSVVHKMRQERQKTRWERQKNAARAGKTGNFMGGLGNTAKTGKTGNFMVNLGKTLERRERKRVG